MTIDDCRLTIHEVLPPSTIAMQGASFGTVNPKSSIVNLLGCFCRELAQRDHEGAGALGRFDFAGQRGAEGHHAAVKVARAGLVLLYHGAVEADPGKHSARPRIGKDF